MTPPQWGASVYWLGILLWPPGWELPPRDVIMAALRMPVARLFLRDGRAVFVDAAHSSLAPARFALSTVI